MRGKETCRRLHQGIEVLLPPDLPYVTDDGGVGGDPQLFPQPVVVPGPETLQVHAVVDEPGPGGGDDLFRRRQGEVLGVDEDDEVAALSGEALRREHQVFPEPAGAVGEIEAVAGMDHRPYPELPSRKTSQHAVLGVMGMHEVETALPYQGLEAAVGTEVRQGGYAAGDGDVVHGKPRALQRLPEGGHPAGDVHLMSPLRQFPEKRQHVGRGGEAVQVANLEHAQLVGHGYIICSRDRLCGMGPRP